MGGSGTLLESMESISLALEGWSFPQAQAETGTIREYFVVIKRISVVC